MKKFINTILNYPKFVVLMFLSLALLSIFFTLNYLKIDTSTDSLINENLDFKINQKKLKNEFKFISNNILIRLSSSNKLVLNDYTQNLIEKLKKRKDLNFVYSPSTDPLFKENFFSFLNHKEKKKIVQKLYEYQPFLSEINNNPRIEGFNNLLSLALKTNDQTSLDNFYPILISFSESLKNDNKVDWSNIFGTNINQNFIVVGYKEEFKKKFDDFYSVLINQKKDKSIKIEFTGGLVIDYEEINSVSTGNAIAGILSILIVSLILWIAFKNIRIILILVGSILVGLSITMGVVSLTIGRLNLISVAFAVLFIGLTVDYGIQIVLRIFERHKIERQNILLGINSISNTLLVASIPTMIGFLSFLPTNYIGLSELGIISFIGLIIGLFTNLIFLPSLLIILLQKIEIYNNDKKTPLYERIIFFLMNKKSIVYSFIFFVFSFNFIFLEKISFDYDAMNLKDQNLASVKLAKEMIKKNPSSDYVISLTLKKEDLKDTQKLDLLLEKESIDSYFSFLDINSEFKDDDLEYLKFLIGSEKNPEFYANEDQIEIFKKNLVSLSKIGSKKSVNLANEILNTLEVMSLDVEKVKKIQFNFFSGFDILMKKIQSFGLINENFFQEIPDYYSKRYVSNNHNYRVEIFPSKDVSSKTNLDEFVNDVESIFPNATGMPIVQQKAGLIVIESFITALTISIIFLIIFIYIIFKRFIYVLVSALCLLVAFMFSIFIMILFNINLNFANMIALPLLYSLGISFTIYFIRRFIQYDRKIDNVIKSNTPKAIFFSAATTMGSFSTLAISSHSGTSSMGLLLFICLLMTVLSAVFILPVLLSSFKFSTK
tara:strand:- start:824 stop:3313 length:2490 start_codon:yes stop_codon:yes gene_type:complete